ncbi:rho GTPase-activating protein 45-like [Vombatus ursinus]|uniref:rho GTPase-activating protein 45-like n=1 Tax=Vombatus ursinus TaxID=29139 RepID=UPI000FFD9963|nr:rho GTPase-activating protein 45-like [Vombatus ursinus]
MVTPMPPVWRGSAVLVTTAAFVLSPQCCLACHKKCLETLAIQCGHKKLQGKLQLFGQDFQKAARGTADGIPLVIKKCLSEIERRALRTKGIYRINGVKTRVEKLCQAFENGKELVELSQASPHNISNVLKLYLRQVSLGPEAAGGPHWGDEWGVRLTSPLRPLHCLGLPQTEGLLTLSRPFFGSQ